MPDTLRLSKIATIAAQNDAFRARLPLHPEGQACFSPGITNLWADRCATDAFWARCELIKIVAEFQHCDAASPDAKLDFGVFEWRGERCCWQIEYFDCDMAQRSPDPADPMRTRRRVTIMLLREG